MDSLTYYGLIFSTLAIGLAFFSMWYNSRMTKRRLSKIDNVTIALQGDKDIKTLCNTIRSISPHACPQTHENGKELKLDKTELRRILENLGKELKSEF